MTAWSGVGLAVADVEFGRGLTKRQAQALEAIEVSADHHVFGVFPNVSISSDYSDADARVPP